MASSTASQRRLFMHPAHQRVGVPSEGIAPRPYGRNQDCPREPFAVAPLRVALVADRLDAEARAARASFERAAKQADTYMQCRPVEFEPVDAESADSANADCVVVFRRGLHVARHWADLDAVAPLAAALQSCGGVLVKIEIAGAGRWHPVLAGVGPFVSRHDASRRAFVPKEATPLLIARTAGAVEPVAWVASGRRGRTFHTTLGRSEDFHQVDFVRLVFNALAWIGQ